MPRVITSADDPALAELCGRLAGVAEALDASGDWPAEQLRLCGEYGVYEWFVGRQWGGQAWSQQDVLRAYLAIASSCLTTAFVLTQREGACRRIESSNNTALQAKLLPRLVRGELFATVGISHLTTSRRHLARPVLSYSIGAAGGVKLSGFSPWVTGADHADVVVVGATGVNDDGTAKEEQILAAVPLTLAGVKPETPVRLVGLSASHTGRLAFDNVALPEQWLLGPPAPNVMAAGKGAGTGGLGTSALALGLAQAALRWLEDEAPVRAELLEPLEALRREAAKAEEDLLAAARGEPACSNDELRQRANSLVLRATQSALAAAKGAGYVVGHPAGRWCREALFFLVWSCPQPVLAANLCELAGILE
ncbi:MAG: acyl-CoA dehydrogenase [Planctomycetota bacterium]|nr:MAG: acyl-CoA dehydrogenase [Planctomycetota bacterium]